MPSAQLPFYRCRWLIRLREGSSLPPWQHGVITGLIKSANAGAGAEAPTGHPPNLFVEAPEVGRTAVDAGSEFAFGASIVAQTSAQASAMAHRLTRGVERLGQKAPDRPTVLGGNFDLVAFEDVVARRSLAPGEPLRPIPVEWIAAEVERLQVTATSPLTLSFHVPLRILLPGEKHKRGPKRYAGREAFHTDQFLNQIAIRLRDLGLPAGRGPHSFPRGAMTILDNALEWLTFRYGADREDRAGAVGKLRVAVNDPGTVETLVWGQYVPLGLNAHFGLGRYRIIEAGPDPAPCRRSTTLLDLALEEAAVAGKSRASSLPAADLRTAAESLRTGRYAPQPPARITIRDPDGAPRALVVPVATDRVLQRLLAAVLSPAFDRLFEDSSFAWRRRLSRASAAAAIASHMADGWHYALRADIDRFFPSVPRPRVAARLSAWVGGDPIADAVLTLLGDGSGLPTGAPLSPLLGNLFLDHFDEQIAARGGRLVRYADDFLVLTRTRHEAEAMHAETLRLVEQLELRLNDEASVLDLRDGFRFLGYDFTWEDRWRWEGPRGPVRTGDLGWRDADRVPPLSSLPLAGEEPSSLSTGVVVIGPESAGVDARHGDLIVSARGGDRPIPLGGIDAIVQIGAVAWSPAVAPALLAAGIRASLVSIGGWPLGELSSSPPDDPAAILAQARASETPARTLAIAKGFVHAKLLNTAALASAIEGPDSATAAEFVRSADRAIFQTDIESLRGVEGAAAREWYRLFARSLGNGFPFPGRVAPRATDPVNVMLNIGHTMLHRQAITAIRAAGLSPAIGFLHASGPRYAALAADLQEPFRHLVERAVILATRRLKPGHFMFDDDGEHPLVLQAPAAKTFHALLQRSLQATVCGDGQADPRPWVAQLIHTARRLRAHLLAPDQPWQPFTHPRAPPSAV